MLDDREYMRQPAYRERRMSLTVLLLIINAVVFLVECMVYGVAPGSTLSPIILQHDWLALSLYGIQHWQLWQLVTYQFMHAGLWHLLFNCWAIYVFGREIEEFLGWKKFLTLYLASGVVGGLFQILAAWFSPTVFDGSVVGASACGFGLVAAFAVLFPEREITLLLFFVIPFRLTAKMLLLLSAAIALVGMLNSGSNIANAAHLGGMVTGIVFVRQFIQGRWPDWKFPSRRAAPRRLVAARTGKGESWRAPAGKSDEELSAEEFLQKEVDPILDKISAHGIQSLTKRERETLEQARTKMTKR
jgi:membrane associated rhomboid family serine protease